MDVLQVFYSISIINNRLNIVYRIFLNSKKTRHFHYSNEQLFQSEIYMRRPRHGFERCIRQTVALKKI